MTGIAATDFVLDGGLAYFDSGQVLDPNTQTLVGTLPFTTGFVAPDTASNLVCFLPQNRGLTMTLKGFHPVTFSELWALNFSTPSGVERGLIKLRSGEFAIRTDGNRARILIIRTSSLDVPAADVSLTGTGSPNPVTVGGVVTYVLSARNDGPSTATNVMVSNALPAGTSFLSATTSQGSCTQSNGIIACRVGSLVNGGSATLRITVAANATGSLNNQFGVTHDSADPNPLNNTATITEIVAPLPALAIADAIVLEGSNRTPISFNLGLSARSTVPVSVQYATIDGTAIATQDYDAATGTVIFSPGTTNKTVTLSPGIQGNTIVQSNRFFFITLANPTNATLARSTATGFIVDDDFNSITVRNASVVEGNDGQTNAEFFLFLSRASSNDITVQYELFDGTATAGSDYLARRGNLIFPPGTTNLTLRVPVLGDTVNELDEVFFLQLSDPVNGLVSVNESIGRIINDDPVPTPRIIVLDSLQNQWRVQFASAVGQSYRLERSETLTPESWLIVADQIAGTGDTVAVMDKLPSSASQLFYRVVLKP